MPLVHNNPDDVSVGVSKLDTVDHARPTKVIVIGAGISGILAAIRFPQRIPNLDLVVYDKNPEVGGTWFENQYPRAACDIPAHVYQATFESNPNWSEFYASSKEILQYWKDIVVKYGVRKYMKRNHKVVEAFSTPLLRNCLCTAVTTHRRHYTNQASCLSGVLN
ncbi:dimethylaniline monooxygenase [Aspergillus flavus]|uniref:Dimethylaniline monooxygenase n=1 Tax=Aspergillus flavus TaxID=5059 RepID=A0AB74CGZ8_ASPFL|nr:dimethylaniline monooxygenase [Aspergillus flavus]RMZ45438.1 dimethylaniline monooxygenase [Aspergillus flavus]